MSRKLATATAAPHPYSLLAFADTICSSAFEALVSLSWSPVTSLAERAVISLLKRIQVGQLRITTPTHEYTLGNVHAAALGQPVCELRVINNAFWVRLATMSDLGFAEAYMYGDVEVSDLIAAFRLFLLNKSQLSSLSTGPIAEYLIAAPQAYITSTRFVNSLANSRSNISAHYDISNDMFAAFLSEDMTYSCAIFDELDADLKGSKKNPQRVSSLLKVDEIESDPDALGPIDGVLANAAPDLSMTTDALYHGEMRKLKHIIRKADIRKGHRVLEIGTGWGSFAILAVQLTGCTIDTITLSSEQAHLARSRIAQAGLSSSITVHLMDYRDIPVEWDGVFDRFVSIEMIEALGREYLETYWGVVQRCLKDRDAVGVVQVITIPEARLEKYSRDVDFIRKWVLFPGGFLPSLTLLISTLEKATSGALLIDSVSNIGPHYARTLREWRDRFEAKFESDIVPALRKSYPDTMGGEAEGESKKSKRGSTQKERDEIEVFRRKWLYYFSYCEIGFTERVLGTHIITFTREGNTAYGVQV